MEAVNSLHRAHLFSFPFIYNLLFDFQESFSFGLVCAQQRLWKKEPGADQDLAWITAGCFPGLLGSHLVSEPLFFI